VRSLNISQNTLTEKALDYLVEGLREPSQLRTVIMSMNKISLRQVRSKVEALKAKGVNVSL
jgi:molybdenum cofactor biosynthesis enzyme MoaA